jgi:Questin oxidase-like
MSSVSSAKQALNAILAEGLTKYHVTFNGYLANHIDQVAAALYFLGANGAQIESFGARYPKDTGYGSLEAAREFDDDVFARLKSFKDDDELLCEEKNPLLNGKHEHFAEWRRFWIEKLQAAERASVAGDGNDDALNSAVSRYVPRLMPRLLSAALHPLIEVSLGLDEHVRSVSMVGGGLAYACVTPRLVVDNVAELVTQSVGDEPLLSAGEMLGALRDVAERQRWPGGRERVAGETLADRFELLQGDSDKVATIGRLVSRWRIDELPAAVVELQRGVMAAYAATCVEQPDFFVLHGCTSQWALKRLLASLDDGERESALRQYVFVLALVYLSQRRPALYVPPQPAADALDWQPLVDAAIASADEHMAKIVCAARQAAQADKSHEHLYHFVAKSTLGKVKTPSSYFF